ncbi:MAG: 3-coathanger stack domain-containing protein [Bacteroidota bacterium]
MPARFLTILLLCLAIQGIGHSQIYLDIIEQSTTKNFQEIVDQVEAYYQNRDKGRGSGYKQFKRWEYYHSSRLSADGKVIDVSQRNLDEFYYYQEQVTKNTAGRGENNLNVIAGAWDPIAPTQYSRVVSGHNGGLGRVGAITVDPSNSSILYIGTPGGGLWKSTNNGGSWVSLTDGIPRIGISGIAIDYSTSVNNRTLYILTGDGDGNDTPSIGVLKSMDNGQTWYSTGLTGADLNRPYKIKIHPTNPDILFVADYYGVFKTTDGGLSWTNTTLSLGDREFYDVEFKPGDPSRMYASTDDGTYISYNTGNTWTQTTFTPPSGTRRIELAVSLANPSYVYALCGGFFSNATIPYGYSGLFRSTNSGVNYTLQSNEPNILGYHRRGKDERNQANYDLAIAVSPTNANEVHIGGINCWKSTNGGSDWDLTSYWVEDGLGNNDYTHADIHALEFSASGTLYCGSDGGIYRSTDNADKWASISEGVQISQIYKLGLGTESNSFRSPLYFGAQDNGLNAVKANSDEARHWEGADGMEVTVMPNSRWVVGAIQRGELKKMDNELTMLDITPAGQVGAWVTPLVSWDDGSTSPDNDIYVGYEDVWFQSKSNGFGPTSGGWSNISNGNIGTGKCRHIAVAPSIRSRIYVSKGNNIWRTTNLGNSWTNISAGLPTSTITYFVVHPTNPDIVYLTTSRSTSGGEKVYRTTNGGNSWVDISGSLPGVPINCIVYQNGSSNGIYVGMDVGVYYLDDNLSDWIPFYNELPNVEVTELEIDYANNFIYAATYGRGIWRSNLYGKECKEAVTLSANLEGFRYVTGNNISSTSLVEPFANVTLEAGTSITLEDGFEVSSAEETVFSAMINPNVCADGINA